MASHIDHIKAILQKNEVVSVPNSLPRLTIKQLKSSPHYEEIKEVYQDLGGQKADLPFGLNAFSVELFNKALVIDDATHFNSYRTQTLRSDIYDDISGIDLQAYRRICRQEQRACLAAASHSLLWTDKASERHFGESNASGDLGLNGSSAWKMRAFIDFLTDTTSLILPYEVVRISIYDSLMISGKIVPLKEVLLSRKEENEKIIFSYLSRKLGLVKKDINQFMKEELKKTSTEENSL